MSRIISFLMVLLCSNKCFTQNISVANEGQDIVYAGIGAPLKIIAEGYSCKQLHVYTNNGKIEGDLENPCNFTLTARHVGMTKITLSVKINNKVKKIGDADFRVKDIPEPVFKLGDESDSVPMALVAKQIFAIADNSNPVCDDICNYRIDSFELKIISNKQVVVEHKNIGYKLDSTVLSAFHSLLPRDMVILTNIYATTFARAANGKQRRAKSIIKTVY